MYLSFYIPPFLLGQWAKNCSREPIDLVDFFYFADPFQTFCFRGAYITEKALMERVMDSNAHKNCVCLKSNGNRVNCLAISGNSTRPFFSKLFIGCFRFYIWMMQYFLSWLSPLKCLWRHNMMNWHKISCFKGLVIPSHIL